MQCENKSYIIQENTLNDKQSANEYDQLKFKYSYLFASMQYSIS